MTQKIPINPEILIWARESCGVSLEQISQKHKKYVEWEKGNSFPTYSQLSDLAKEFQRPIALFFFPQPPEEENLKTNLRTLDENSVKFLNKKIYFLFRKAKNYQESLKEIYAEKILDQIKRIEWLNSEKKSIEDLATYSREEIGISIDDQCKYKDAEDTLREYRRAFAKKGIYIFKEAFSNDKVSGFCIYDEVFPIIFLNSSQPKTRQLFTLFHELGHLLFKDSYLDIFDSKFWQIEQQDPSNIEVRCNKFAAYFLLPDKKFKKEANDIEITDSSIERLSKTFNVSRHVVLRKFLDIKRIDKNFYNEKILNLYKEFEKTKETTQEKPKASKGGPSYYILTQAKLGEQYIASVLKRYYEGRFDLEQTSDYLDIKPQSFFGLEEIFLKNKNMPNVHF